MSEQKLSVEEGKTKESRVRRVSLKHFFVGVPLLLFLVVVSVSGYVYAVSPDSIRNPKMEHYHFRLQSVVDGKNINFADPKFQKSYAKGQCSGELSSDPIHFHDQKNQFVHIHWAKMTGGLVMKNYGWNFIDGKSDLLGYRLDELPKIQSVPIHSNALPEVPHDAVLWVYTGDEKAHQKRSIDAFARQDLETFFNKKSTFMSAAESPSIMSWLFPKASAHNGEDHSTSVSEEERLSKINNLLGNVVIFAQKDEPSDEDIRARFADLEPLSDSTCGG
jgi:hypothetical protein